MLDEAQTKALQEEMARIFKSDAEYLRAHREVEAVMKEFVAHCIDSYVCVKLGEEFGEGEHLYVR